LGGPAALRSQKTVKYLSEMGCKIDVITVGDIEYNYHDASLVQQSKERTLIRTTSLDPMSLLKKLAGKKSQVSQNLYRGTPERLKLFIRRLYPLDDKVGWLPPLLAAGKKAMRSNRYDFIYVSCGPFSSALAAWKLSKQFNVPFVVEMRDYWTLLSDYNLQGNILNRSLSKAMERKILSAATGIVTATKGIAEDIADAFGCDLRAKLLTVYNGHDETDYHQLRHPEKQETGWVLSYFGALYARRSLANLFSALKELNEAGKLPQGTLIRLVGNYNREAMQEIEKSGISNLISVIPQLQHKDAIEQMAISDALILVINSSSPYGTLTSKVFEYLRIGKPILAMIPAHSEAAELLKESGQDYICAMESVSSIKVSLQWLINDRKEQRTFSYPAAKYARKAQIGELYKFMEKLVK
jgi:glycosyltransferase involved in cell wall biosynthesis